MRSCSVLGGKTESNVKVFAGSFDDPVPPERATMPIRSSISTTWTRPSLVSLLLSGRQRTTTFTHSLGAMLPYR